MPGGQDRRIRRPAAAQPQASACCAMWCMARSWWPSLIVVALIVSGRTVVPGVSERLYKIHFDKDDSYGVAKRYGLDPYMVAAVVKTESDFDSDAVSPVGAVGLMQLMPETADWMIGLALAGPQDPDLKDPYDNLELGACYLAYLVARFDEVDLTACWPRTTPARRGGPLGGSRGRRRTRSALTTSISLRRGPSSSG